MDTKELMELSLRLSGFSKIPEDSAVYVEGENIRKVLFSIDAGVPELMLSKQLGYDCVIAHHPAGGTALIDFHKVFLGHIQQMVEAGVPRDEAQKAVEKKLADLEVDSHTRNFGHNVDVAKLLKMPYMNIHTPLDEIGRKIMSEQITKVITKNTTVQDVVDTLNELPEFKNAVTKIRVRVGKPENPAGKVVVSHGAGTNGGYEIAKTYIKHGIGTVIYIHIGLGDLERLKADNKGNLIVTGHIASDSAGINPFLNELKRKGISVMTIGVIGNP